jgi:hypothetical protein
MESMGQCGSYCLIREVLDLKKNGLIKTGFHKKMGIKHPTLIPIFKILFNDYSCGHSCF